MISSVHRFKGREGGLGRIQRIFRALKILNDTGMVDYVFIYLSKPIDYRTPRANPNVNCRCNRCATLVGGVDVGEPVRGEAGCACEFSVLSTQLCCEPKIL